MKKTFFILVVLAGFGCGSNETAPEVKKEETPAEGYTKNDLQKIKWIEGEWMGLYNGSPFYEMYRFANDSTLEILSYDWNGKDSSNSKLDYLYFKEGSYYLGDKQNWKVTAITEKEIKMDPQRQANNDITWRYRDSTGWDAILVHKGGTTVYNMKHSNPFKQ